MHSHTTQTDKLLQCFNLWVY